MIVVEGNFSDEKGNKIVAPEGLKNVRVIFKGSNNVVRIHSESMLSDCTIEFASDYGFFSIGQKCPSMKFHLRVGYFCSVFIGDGCSATNSLYMTCAEKTSIQIGNDCMFATSNQIRTDDAHAIYDSVSGERLNFSSNIVIGNHVWVAYNAVIMGGAFIGDGSVVGYGSFVNGCYPNNCLIVGTPAKVVKKNVGWKRPNLVNNHKYKELANTQLPEKYFDPTRNENISLKRLERVFELRKLDIKGGLLFIEGIFILLGVPGADYSDLNYLLHLENEEGGMQLPLAKSNAPDLTKVYGKGEIDYSKCYFTTNKHQGVKLPDLKDGRYHLFVSIFSKVFSGRVRLESMLDQNDGVTSLVKIE